MPAGVGAGAGLAEQREDMPGHEIVLPEAGAVEAGAGEASGARRPGHGRPEQEQTGVRRAVPPYGSAHGVSSELTTPERGAVRRDQVLRGELPPIEEAADHGIRSGEHVGLRQTRLNKRPRPDLLGHGWTCRDERAVPHADVEVGSDEMDDAGPVQGEQLTQPARRWPARDEGEEAGEIGLDALHAINRRDPARGNPL